MNNEMKALGQLPGSDNKVAYDKPVLTVIGDLRTFTLAPSQVTTIESDLGTVYGYTQLGPGEFTTDQFESRSSRSSASDGGRGGRSS